MKEEADGLEARFEGGPTVAGKGVVGEEAGQAFQHCLDVPADRRQILIDYTVRCNLSIPVQMEAVAASSPRHSDVGQQHSHHLHHHVGFDGKVPNRFLQFLRQEQYDDLLCTGSTEGVSGTGRFDERKVLIDDCLVVFPPATSFFRSDMLLTPVQSDPK